MAVVLAVGVLGGLMQRQELQAQEPTVDASNSVVQMDVAYTDAEGNTQTVQSGCGFFLGSKENGVEYIMTAKEVTTVSEEDGVEEESQEAEIVYEVKALINDESVAVEQVAESEEMGFSLWKLSQPILDKKPLAIYDMDMVALEGQSVTALGIAVGEKANVISQKGHMLGVMKDGNVKFMQHDMNGNVELKGGPILDEHGYVIALYQSKMVEEQQYALQMSEMIPVLDALGVSYETGSAIEAEKEAQLQAQREAELAAMADKKELQKVITAAEKIKADGYTQASFEAMKQSLEEAKSLFEKKDATQDEVDAMVEQLSVMITALKEKLPGWIFIIMAVVVLVVIGSVVSVVWMRTSEDRELKKQKAYAKYMAEENTSSAMSEAKVTRDNLPRTGEETMLLMPDMDETVLLYYEEPKKKNMAYLTRTRTGEKIDITTDQFVLGKDPSQTDYYIVGNSAISRAHAVITSNDDGFEVEDKNATNGTFVNCMRIEAFQKMTLKDGDTLRLADEDFSFNIVEAV